MQNQIQASIQQAIALMQQGRLDDAERLLEQVLNSAPNESNALHILGAVEKARGQFDRAKACYEKALLGAPNNPEIYNSLANLLKQAGDLEGAVTHFKRAIELKPDYAAAWFNLGVSEQSAGRVEDAKISLEKAVSLTPGNPSYQNALGVIYRNLEQYDAAVKCYELAISLNANYFKAHHNLGLTRFLMNDYAAALQSIKIAINMQPKQAESRYVAANIYRAKGDFEKADIEYRTVLSIDPGYVDAHTSLNALYWEYGKKDLYGKSYRVGIEHTPNIQGLYEYHIDSFERLGKQEEGREKLEIYLKKFPENTELLRLKGRFVATLDDADGALLSFEKAIRLAPTMQKLRFDIARHLIQMGRYDEALLHLESVEKYVPFEQEMWAYKGLCWRLMGDARHEWLNDYDQFVSTAILRPPGGYSDVDAFLTDLSAHLRDLHVSKHHPLDQSLRGGSQTSGRLLNSAEPIIVKLKAALAESVAEYLERLPSESEHPFLGRKSMDFDFSASWSVWLRRDGFHVNHVHPMGWLSSSFYVELPHYSDDEASKKEGWIKFGESGLGLGDREVVGKYVQPKPGMLALFPSYMWHGTVPFSREADRITAPFDIVPI